jgi:hypothetical protein
MTCHPSPDVVCAHAAAHPSPLAMAACLAALLLVMFIPAVIVCRCIPIERTDAQ